MRSVLEKGCRDNQNTRFVFSNFFLKNHAVYEIRWKNTIQPDRLQTQTQNIIAFPLQQWLQEGISIIHLFVHWLSY